MSHIALARMSSALPLFDALHPDLSAASRTQTVGPERIGVFYQIDLRTGSLTAPYRQAAKAIDSYAKTVQINHDTSPIRSTQGMTR